jgi:hypothetical protein
VQFESIRSGYGMLNAADSGLVAGTDYSGADLTTEAGSVGGQLAGTTDGAWVRYQGVDLGAHHATTLSVRYDAPTTKVVDGSLAFYVDAVPSSTAEPFVTVPLPSTGSGWGTYNTATVTLPSQLTGSHTIYVALHSTPTSSQPYVGNLDWFALGYGVDKTALEAAIAKDTGLTSDADLYLVTDFGVFTRALAAAKSVDADEDATADDVATALRALEVSADQLEWKVVKQVAQLLGQAEAVEQDDVTAASWARLRKAVAAAEALDPATSSHRAYETALANLRSAYDRLEPAPIVAKDPVWISGDVVVGGTLTIHPGTYSVTDPAFAYSWYADGHRIAGADGSTFVLTKAQAGKRITAAIVVSAPGRADLRVVTGRTVPVERGR